MLSRGHLNVYPLGRKLDFFLFLAKTKVKRVIGNFPFPKKIYFVRKVTPYLQSNFGSSRYVNNIFRAKNVLSFCSSANEYAL